MKKYKAHIISHSHWDREWYLPYEKHHLKLIDLIDQILDEIDTNPKFNSFHLDGQTIIVEDYLQIKPQNRDRLLNAIKSGKIKIGPWYILQDAFLTSSEANIRNLQIGNLDAKRYGNKTHIGYFPDTFGIYSQAAQILKKSDIDNMFFGRGVTPTGFNNQVGGDFESNFSEMIVKAPNEDAVLGILFANWYSNGDGIPVDTTEAKAYWDKKLADVKRFTPNKHLLFMNGCDHTPMQPNITQAIDVANTLYDDVEFIHSSLEDYLKEVKKEINNKGLSVIKNELRSQDTEGYYTLVNTLSSRIKQKQQNVKIQDLFTQVVEPLATMIMPPNKYPSDKITYGWKTLMQNHPHDSICGCSCDEVHDLMDMRFANANHIGEGIIDSILNYYKQHVNKNNDDLEFTVFNTTSTTKDEVIQVIIDYKKEYFGLNFNDNRKNLEKINIPNLLLKDNEDNKIPVYVEDLGTQFDYELPDDKFRKSFYARKIQLTFRSQIDKFSWATYKLEESDILVNKINNNNNILENENIKLEILNNGEINLENKNEGILYKNILEIIDQGDLGNEYMFGAVKDDQEIKISSIDKIIGIDNDINKIKEVYATMKLPKSATDSLQEEKRKLVEFYKRESRRSDELIDVPIKITFELENHNNKLHVKLNFTNPCKDHRMRFKINLKQQPKIIKADGVFEITHRTTTVSSKWKNPNNDQPMQKFLCVNDENNSILIGTQGLHEYEVKDKSLYITFLRSVSELGDWGDFPTPKAQCIDNIEANITITLDTSENEAKHYNDLRNDFITLPYVQIYKNNGNINKNNKYLNIDIDKWGYISSLKRNDNLDVCLRMFSNGRKSNVNIQENYVLTNLLEGIETKKKLTNIEANEIVTIKLK